MKRYVLFILAVLFVMALLSGCSGTINNNNPAATEQTESATVNPTTTEQTESPTVTPATPDTSIDGSTQPRLPTTQRWSHQLMLRRPWFISLPKSAQRD